MLSAENFTRALSVKECLNNASIGNLRTEMFLFLYLSSKSYIVSVKLDQYSFSICILEIFFIWTYFDCTNPNIPVADSRKAFVSFWRKNVHNTG